MLERQTSKARAEEGQYEPAYTVLGPTDRNTTKNNLLSNQPVVSKDTTKPSLTMTNTGGSLGKCKKIYL